MSTDSNFGDCKQKPLLLFSCLDWGLGHTTRSIPLIKEFSFLGWEVIVACNSVQKKILEPECPTVRFVDLKGYGLKYGRNRISTRFNLVAQLFKILIRIKYEMRWLKRFSTQNHVSAVISDNRYGFFHTKIPSILITHQLNIRTGFGNFANEIFKKIICKFIRRFTYCWVPDFENFLPLAGTLSQNNEPHPSNIEYLGPFSRFSRCNVSLSYRYDLLVLISGPEPQRTIFEKIILGQCNEVNVKVALVRGLPGNIASLTTTNIEIFNHLDAEQLNKLICESEIVLCRSGYTTIMDLVKLRKKMIVVPTPGQAEQEYLAMHLSKNKIALSFNQHKLSISRALQSASFFPYHFIDHDMNDYKIVVKKFTEKINSGSPFSKR